MLTNRTAALHDAITALLSASDRQPPWASATAADQARIHLDCLHADHPDPSPEIAALAAHYVEVVRRADAGAYPAVPDPCGDRGSPHRFGGV
jgi:hypothetical protein